MSYPGDVPEEVPARGVTHAVAEHTDIDATEVVYQVVHTPPVRPSTLGRVSTAIEDVLAVAMAKDPRKRFPSAMTFAQAFIAARRGRKVAIDIPDHAWL